MFLMFLTKFTINLSTLTANCLDNWEATNLHVAVIVAMLRCVSVQEYTQCMKRIQSTCQD